VGPPRASEKSSSCRFAASLRSGTCEKFPGHIACDSGTKSELVVPVVVRGELVSVLDLDSRSPDAFAREEADRLAAFLGDVFC
jgi:putative methionine-R-sulfoxide reductase with GAF domain